MVFPPANDNALLNSMLTGKGEVLVVEWRKMDLVLAARRAVVTPEEGRRSSPVGSEEETDDASVDERERKAALGANPSTECLSLMAAPEVRK